MSLLKSTVVIGSCTLLSRVLGFLRDILIANSIGASWLSDAFFLAFKLPNFFRRLFAEGAFNVAFVPLFSGMLEEDGKDKALKFAGEALSVLLCALLLLNAIFFTFMPVIMPFLAPGFVDNLDKFALSVELTRITFGYILFISVVSLFGGILNSMQHFAAVALTPVLLNLCLIAALLGLTHYTPTPAHALSWGVFIAGLVQCGWLIVACKRAEALPSLLIPKITPQVRKLLILMAPAALGAGVAQVNLLIDLILASRFDEAVSYLYYADRLNQLPIGVIGVAAGTALLPMLSRQIKSGDTLAATNTLNNAIWFTMLAALPAATAFLIMPDVLIQVLFEHGAFTATDTAATYTALMAYAAGLPAFILVKLFAPGFYAAEDTKTPFKVATFCVALNLILNLILMQHFEHVGLAMATSIASWVNVILLAFLLSKAGRFVPARKMLISLFKILIACAVMGAALYYAIRVPGAVSIFGLVATIVGAKIVYGGSIVVLGVANPREIKGLLRKQ